MNCTTCLFKRKRDLRIKEPIPFILLAFKEQERKLVSNMERENIDHLRYMNLLSKFVRKNIKKISVTFMENPNTFRKIA